MKKPVVIFFGVCCLSGCGNKEVKVYNEGIHIIPSPLHVVEEEGYFLVKDGMTITASPGEAEQVGSYLRDRLSSATGYQFDLKDSKDATEGNITLQIDEGLNIDAEGYRLEVSPTQVTILAQAGAGLFYGVQTLLQLLPAEIESTTRVKGVPWMSPSVKVEDAPRFGYRGIMLDVCRHFLSVERIKKQLDVLSLFKINRFHWHLTDDQGWRIEIKKYPKLTQVGGCRIEGEGYEYMGFYTQDEIREVIDYAAARYITIVPEIEMPGHALAAIAAYPELSCKGEATTPRIVWGVEDIVFCAGKEETFRFLEDVISEVAALFPGEYIHIGGDECPKRAWVECPLCQKRIQKERLMSTGEYTAEEQLQSYFIQRMEKVVASHGKKIIGWDEILEGGLAPTATVMSWRGEKGGIAAANMEHDVIMTPGVNGLYIDQFEGDPKVEPVAIGGLSTVEKVYSYDPVPEELAESGKGGYIKGVQCNVWAEYLYTPDKVEYRAYPRILALSETGWTQTEQKDYEDFLRRLDNALVRLDYHEINYHIPQPEQPNGSVNFIAFTDTVSVSFQISRPLRIVYTLDESEPTSSSLSYMSAIPFQESGTIKVRSILLASGKMSPVRTIRVEKQELLPAKKVASALVGLNLAVTYGSFLSVTAIPEDATWTQSVLPSLSKLPTLEEREWGGSIRDVRPYAAEATGYVDIPSDGVYFFSTDNEELWIDGQRIISNEGEVKRFSHHDTSIALAEGMHEIKVVFLSHIIGGWPTIWGSGNVLMRKAGGEAFAAVSPEMLFHP
ncbi:MAG: family 20 glycosylhydrolase [Tannerellaceae bacterium]|jgi:hexosaminidase|nr:family 20 glycosylhydrolase [Tannerellaceae bacterium]